MASKKKIRVAKAREGVKELVDEGADIDVELKNLKYRDKAYRAKITDNAVQELQENEKSLRLLGDRAEALVSVSTKLNLDVANAVFTEKIEPAIEKGEVDGVVDKKVKANIAPKFLEKVKEVLGTKLFEDAVTVNTEYNVNSEGFRVLQEESKNSPEKKEIADALKSCIEEKTTTKVKYGYIDEK